jgi:hypothetical protein
MKIVKQLWFGAWFKRGGRFSVLISESERPDPYHRAGYPCSEDLLEALGEADREAHRWKLVEEYLKTNPDVKECEMADEAYSTTYKVVEE